MANYLLLFCFLLPLQAIPQQRESNNIQLVDSLLSESSAAMLNVDIERTIELSLEALALSNASKYNQGMVRSYYTIGQALFHNQNYNEALTYLSRADKVKNSSKFPLYMAQIYKVKGQIYFYLEMERKAIREFHRALKIAEDIPRDDYRSYVTSQIYESFITVYHVAEKSDSAFYYMQKNKDLLVASQDETFIYPNKINMYGYFGEYYILTNQPDSAMQYLNEGIQLIDKYNFRYRTRTLKFIGDVELMRGNYREALDHYLDAIENASELGMRSELPTIHENIAQVYQHLNLPDSAAKHFNQKVFFENELLKDKVSTTGQALQILLDEEKKISDIRAKKLFIAAIITTTIIGIIISQFVWKRRHKEIIEEVDVEKNQLKQQLNMAFDQVMNLAKNNDPAFLVRFQEVYPEFMKSLHEKHPDLTPTELRLCAMTYLNLPTRDIAAYTFVEIRSVQTSRSRLRKKINLPPDTDLFVYLQSL